MAEQPDAQIPHSPLRNLDHQAVIRPGREYADGVHHTDFDKLDEQRMEVRVAGLNHRDDVGVIEFLQKQRAVELCGNRGNDTHKDGDTVPLIVLPHDAERTSQHLSHILRAFRRNATGAVRSVHRSCCHYASPAFSSKSPPPCVWPCQTS